MKPANGLWGAKWTENSWLAKIEVNSKLVNCRHTLSEQHNKKVVKKAGEIHYTKVCE